MSEQDAPKKNRARAPRKAKEGAAPVAVGEAAPSGAELAVLSEPMPSYAQRFRSAGTVTDHVCPNGHGATEPVEPGHTWCPKCLQHWTVAATA